MISEFLDGSLLIPLTYTKTYLRITIIYSTQWAVRIYPILLTTSNVRTPHYITYKKTARLLDNLFRKYLNVFNSIYSAFCWDGYSHFVSARFLSFRLSLDFVEELIRSVNRIPLR